MNRFRLVGFFCVTLNKKKIHFGLVWFITFSPYVETVDLAEVSQWNTNNFFWVKLLNDIEQCYQPKTVDPNRT